MPSVRLHIRDPRRRHSSLGYLSPAEFERRAQHQTTVAWCNPRASYGNASLVMGGFETIDSN
jgi:hypothetical protein